ncbi:hypothetical protein [Flavobacterium cerinum]|uniref:DUF2726 domain-containing protein n=1 Tax=Flavobacterium cerinum TaxID=2502784 RepID=A0ABY5INJ9_9FLAO|nr:hypothetical protein [Flavobacterium cerinum]UUC44416.1 hypothetical protein NOX80_12320 [Flavobacterium cerinum]
MHVSPKYDFEISFLEEIDKELYPEDLVTGIFEVIMNTRLGIYVRFIPEIDGIDEKWPFDFVDYDETTIQGIRKLLLLESVYVVTPSDKWKGETKKINKEFIAKCFDVADIENMRDVVVFFISKADFELYENEKEKMSVSDPHIKDNRYKNFIANLEKEYKLPVFLKTQIINSPYLSDEELFLLMRKRDEKGNIVVIEN